MTTHDHPDDELDDDVDDGHADDDVDDAGGGRRSHGTARRVGQAAARAGRRARAGAGPGVHAAEATFEGSGSGLGVVVGMFALVLLYVLLTRSGAVAALVHNVSTWLAKFMSPNFPLIG